MQVLVTKVDAVRPHGENLSIVTVGEHEVIANRKSDGTFRWEAGEVCVYVPEGAIIPDDVLKERGYWDEEKDRGLLDGGKRNRVKMKKLAGFESRGLLFKVARNDLEESLWLQRGGTNIKVEVGDNVMDFLGITEFVPQ